MSSIADAAPQARPFALPRPPWWTLIPVLLHCCGNPLWCDGKVENIIDEDGDGAVHEDSVLEACTCFDNPETCFDCDDGNAAVFPGALDPDGDGVDQDCDGLDSGRCGVPPSLSGIDADGDGLFVPDPDGPPGSSDCVPTDCDDTDESIGACPEGQGEGEGEGE